MTTWRKSLLVSCVTHLVLLFVFGFWLKSSGAQKNPDRIVEIELATVNQLQSNSLLDTSHSAMLPTKSPTAITTRMFSQNVENGAVTSTVTNNCPPASLVQTGSISESAVISPLAHTANTTVAAAPCNMRPPQVLSKREPVYPEQARRDNKQGTVTIKVEILQTGKPANVIVVASSGCDILDRAAVEAVRNWSFIPAEDGITGAPLHCVTQVPITFRLN